VLCAERERVCVWVIGCDWCEYVGVRMSASILVGCTKARCVCVCVCVDANECKYGCALDS
jgi:hypothetical protein